MQTLGKRADNSWDPLESPFKNSEPASACTYNSPNPKEAQHLWKPYLSTLSIPICSKHPESDRADNGDWTTSPRMTREITIPKTLSLSESKNIQPRSSNSLFFSCSLNCLNSSLPVCWEVFTRVEFAIIAATWHFDSVICAGGTKPMPIRKISHPNVLTNILIFRIRHLSATDPHTGPLMNPIRGRTPAIIPIWFGLNPSCL